MATISFEDVVHDKSNLPGLEQTRARDGSSIFYRYYDGGPATVVIVMMHGSGWHSQEFATLGYKLASGGHAHVYTPDLRGHGPNARDRGDVQYVGQLEDDLDDILTYVRSRHQGCSIILGGHSSGGGLVIRSAGRIRPVAADAYLLLAPYLSHNSPTARPNMGGWANIRLLQLFALLVLNGFGVTRFNRTSVIRFNMPIEVRDGTETLEYSFRMLTSYNPRPDYASDLSCIQKPCLVLVGSSDDAFFSEAFAPLFAQYVPQSVVTVVPGVSHIGIVHAPGVMAHIQEWLPQIRPV